jgi:hypothetical protein
MALRGIGEVGVGELAKGGHEAAPVHFIAPARPDSRGLMIIVNCGDA